MLAVLLGGTWGAARLVGWASARESLASFASVSQALAPLETRSNATAAPDQSLWDAGRIRAYARALTRAAPAPLAVLRIPRLHLEVPVLEGTDEWTLDRAVGHLEGTPAPGGPGNVAIAGHRDGFFRVLKDIREGDVMELAVLGGVQRYRVERLSVVGPDDVGVLAPTAAPTLTLVTCYPFYFVGPAPQRFIVQARGE